MSREPFVIMHRDDFETTGRWRLARRSLELESFGMNVVDVEPGEQIPEHDETDRDQEEVFVVLDGHPEFVVDGRPHAARPGSFLRLDPEPTRTVRNNSDGTASVMIVSAPRTSGYQPMDWA
jgi:quercetin dioxygenase-like cupin family protein